MPDLRIGSGLPVKSKNKFAILTLFDLELIYDEKWRSLVLKYDWLEEKYEVNKIAN
jgi:hypothetical protein